MSGSSLGTVIITRRPVQPWLGPALMAMTFLSLVLAGVAAGRYQEWTDFWQWMPAALAFGVVGAILVARVPHNAVSWLTLSFGLAMSVELLTLLVSDQADIAGDVTALAEWTALLRLVGIDLLMVILIPLVLLFPDGRLPSRRWRAVLWLTAVFGSLATLVSGATTANWHNRPDPNYRLLQPPFRSVPLPHAQQWYDLATVGLLLLFVTASAGLVWRYRHSSAQQRVQIKWVVAAAVVMGLGFLISAAGYNSTLGASLTLPLLPVAIGLAVLRFRLYDIDRLISRTVSYALVTGCVLLVYTAIVSLAGRLVPDSSNLAVAAATLAAAAVARPVLHRVQRWVDRRFNRPRFDAVATVERFGVELRHETEVERVEQELLAAVRETLQPGHARLWTAAS